MQQETIPKVEKYMSIHHTGCFKATVLRNRLTVDGAIVLVPLQAVDPYMRAHLKEH